MTENKKRPWKEPERLKVPRERVEKFAEERDQLTRKIATLMKEYRAHSGLSVREAAQRAGCHYRTLFAYESGARKSADVFEVAVFCRVFGVSFLKFSRDLGL